MLGYAAQITALTAEFLDLVAELDERESWRGPGDSFIGALVVVEGGGFRSGRRMSRYGWPNRCGSCR